MHWDSVWLQAVGDKLAVVLISLIVSAIVERVAKSWRNRSATKSESLQKFEKFTGR